MFSGSGHTQDPFLKSGFMAAATSLPDPRGSRDSTGAARALQPHKHAAAPGGVRASVKDISEVSRSCNKLLGSAPQHRCDLLFSVFSQPVSQSSETGHSQGLAGSTSNGV